VICCQVPQAGCATKRDPRGRHKSPPAGPGPPVSSSAAQVGRRTDLSAAGMNQPHAERYLRSRQQTGRSTAIRIGGHSLGRRGSAVFGPCGAAGGRLGPVRGAGVLRPPRQPRGCPDLEITLPAKPPYHRYPAQAGQRGRSCGRPGGLAQCAGFRSGRCGRVKLPVFLPGRRSPDRDNFCPMQRNSMPHRPGAGARAGIIDGSGWCCWPRRSRSCTCAGYRSRPTPGHLHRCRADGREHGRCRARRCRKIRPAQERSPE